MKNIARFCLVLTLLSFTFITIGDTPNPSAVFIDKAKMRALLADGKLTITAPVTRSADGELGLEVISFDGNSLAKTGAPFKSAKSPADLSLSAPVKLTAADAPKTLVRLTAKTAAGESVVTANLFEILQRLETQLFAQSEFLAGSRASVRILTLDQKTKQPISAKLAISLKVQTDGKTADKLLYSGETGKDGSANVSFTLPDNTPPQATLAISTTSPLGSDYLEQSITLKPAAKILLTSDKPLYQPGQLMHLRALILRADNQQPIANTDATIEVLDAKGNKVFKKQDKTDAFGIIACDFSLARECLMGEYKIRAIVGDPNAPFPPVTSEKDVTVKRYVLPKFKVTFSTDKQFYRPGETVKGEIQADYFFGKPTARAEVQVKTSKFDIEWSRIGEIVGRTDDKGHYTFELKLPDHFVGQPFEQGNARVKFDITVRDEAEHSENITQTRTVAKDAINIFAIPESGRLVPNLEQRVFVMTTYPDGSPAKTKITLPEQKLAGETDALGIATFIFKPEIKEAAAQAQKPQMGRFGRRGLPMAVADAAMPDGGNAGEDQTPAGPPFALKIEASDAKGNKGERTINLGTEAGAETLLARLSQPLAKVGDKLTLDVITTRKAGTVYVDIIKNRQTMATYSLEVKDSRGSLEIPLTAELVGSTQIHCYLLDAAGDTIRDTKLLFVNAADDLKIQTAIVGERGVKKFSEPLEPWEQLTQSGMKLIHDHYFPGEGAKLEFTVTDSKKNPVQTALGVVIVDEAVFALQEMQPGLEKVYFLLEQEIMKPRIEIHEHSLDNVIQPLPMPFPGPAAHPPMPEGGLAALFRKQQAARVLFAAAEMVYRHPVKVSSSDKNAGAYAEAAIKKIQADYAAIQKAIRDYEAKGASWARNVSGTDVLRALAAAKAVKPVNLLDPWGEPYTIGNVQLQGGRINFFNLTWPDNSNYGQWGGYMTPRIAKSLGIDIQKLQREGRWEELQRLEQQFGGGMGRGREVMAMGAGGMRRGGPMLMEMAQMDAAPMMAMAAAPPGAVMEKGAVATSTSGSKPAGAAEPRIRQFFPETLFFAPSVITDAKGKASVPLALADSITTWRLSAMGNAQNGMLGSTQAPIRVFQDFFVDIDLPVTLTQGDQVSIPVAIYNYLKEPQEVRLELPREKWFMGTEEVLEKTAEIIKTKKIEANSVAVVYFDIRVLELGWHKLTIKAIGSKMSDAVRRQIEVVPNGQEQTFVINDSLDGNVEKTVTIPENAIAGASKILVKIYPGIFSQMLEGLDGLLQMPSGCFEQTSSTLYPNILVLDYLKQTRQNKPDIQMKAEGFINHGYQKLLTFEVQGGGFEWFGNAPANQILTAWGLMQFKDMARVYSSVDSAIITRTQNWLVSKQNANGTWSPDKAYLHAESWGNIQGSDLLVTAYITWGLLESGYRGPAVDKAVEVLKKRADEAKDPYMLALVAQALVAWNKEAKETLAVLERARDMAVPQEKEALCWQPKIATATYGHGDSAAIETTAMFAQAFTKAGRYPDVVTKALAYLTRKKDARGAWGSTQATIQALKAFNLALARAGKETDATVAVLVNGKEAQKLKITPADADVLRLVDAGAHTQAGKNKVELKFEGKGAMLYQIVGRYWMPWDAPQPLLGGRPMPLPAPIGDGRPPFEVTVEYDKDKLETEDLLTAKVSVKNATGGVANMVVVDLGVPPGFQVQTDGLDRLVGNKTITRYDMTGRQIILYFDKLSGGANVEFSYELKAKFPVVVSTPRSRVYSYYNPDQQGIAKPQTLTVKAK